MSNFDFNNVKTEKAAAMRRYNRQKKFQSFLFLAEVFAALALFLWYSTYYVPVAADVASDFLRRFVVVFGRSLYVFVVVNVLVVVIFVLSSQKLTESDIYDEYVSITNTSVSGRTVASSSSTDAAYHCPTADEPVTTVSDKQIVCVDNAVHSPPAEQNVVPATTATDCNLVTSPAVSSVRQSRFGGVTETKRYRRTRSERFGKENRPELRRSETVIKRETAAVVHTEAARRSSSAMDDLSSEDFRMTIETFIAAKKKSLIRENTLDLEKVETKECVSITLNRLN